MLNQVNIHSPIMKYRSNWCIFFVMEIKYIEKMMERFNSGDLKKFFRNNSRTVLVGLTTSGRSSRQEEEETRKEHWFFRNNRVCPSSSRTFRKQYYWSYFTGHWLFRTTSSNTFIMSDVQSIYIPSSIRDWYLEVKIWTADRQCSFSLWIPETRIMRILIRSTWINRVTHNSCIKHGRDIKTQYIGSTSILLKRKDWSSIRHDRTPSFFMKHLQPIVSRKLFEWKLEKSYTKKCMRHLGLLQRFPWNMIGWRNWVQKLLDNQKEKLLDKQNVPNQPSQTQIQIMIERRDPLCAHNQSVHPQRLTRWTWTSEYLDCHILLWTKQKCSCSSAREEDRESPPSTRPSSRSATKWCLQPIKWKIKEDDSWHGQWRAIWVVRNNSQNAMLRMPSF